MACIALVFLSAAHAQSPPPAQVAEEGLRRQESRARALQEKIAPRADVLAPRKEAVVTALPDETPCFMIHEIVLEGADAGRFSWLMERAQSFLGRCLGVMGVNQVAQALEAELFDLGYVTSRVALGPQDLSTGVLRFRLQVGRVGAIQMRNLDRPELEDEAWGTWRNAFPVSAGAILNLHDLEQGVEQMQRLPSQQVSTELAPGSAAYVSDLHILRQPGTLAQRIRGGMSLDNSGGEALGRSQLSLYLTADNLLGLNDIATLSANTNLERVALNHRSQSLAFNYSIPWGYNTFSVNRSTTRFAQKVQGTTVSFLSRGSSDNADLRWQRTLLRTSSTRFGVYGAVGTRRARSFLDDVELIVQRRRSTSLETGVSYRQLIGDASVELELGYRRGMPWRNAQGDADSMAEGGLALRPKIWVWSFNYLQSFRLGELPLQYQASLRAQHTPVATISADQFGIGSRYSVRGFDGENILLAESGYALRNELATPLGALGGLEGLNASAYAGIDVGRVWGASADWLVGDRLAGAVVGVRGDWQGVQFDLALAAPLVQPAGFVSNKWNFYLQATMGF